MRRVKKRPASADDIDEGKGSKKKKNKIINNNLRRCTHIRLVTGQDLGVQEGRDGQTVGARLFLVTGPSAVDAVPFVLHGYNNLREIEIEILFFIILTTQPWYFVFIIVNFRQLIFLYKRVRLWEM